jgi:hypothetical protein
VTEFLLGSGVALLATAIGWALGLATELWRERRAAGHAARVVLAELAINYARFLSYRGAGTWVSGEPQQTAWEAHREKILLLGDSQALLRINNGYASLSAVQALGSKAVAEFSTEDQQMWNDMMDMMDGHIRQALTFAGELAGARHAEETIEAVRQSFDADEPVRGAESEGSEQPT